MRPATSGQQFADDNLALAKLAGVIWQTALGGCGIPAWAFRVVPLLFLFFREGAGLVLEAIFVLAGL